MKTKFNAFLLFQWLFFCSFAHSQEITVHLFEMGTGNPVPDGSVVLANTDVFSTTNEKGAAKLDINRIPASLKILASGYESKTHILKSLNESIEIYLQPLTVDAETIEIVAERIPEKTSKVILSSQEIRKVAGTRGDPLGVVYAMPGVTSVGGEIYVRGSSADDSGVWVNRVPVQYLFHWADISGGLSTINPDLLSNFNVFLGGFPVEYRDFLGGMLDVELRKPKNDRFHQKYRIGLNESAFMIEGPVGQQGAKQSFYLTGRKSYLDVFLTPSVINELQGADETNKKTQILKIPQYYDMQAGWNYDFAKGSVEALFLAAGDAIGLRVRGDTEKQTNPDVLGKITASMDYKVLGVNWKQNWSKSWRSIITTSIYNTKQDRSIGSDPFGVPYFVKTNSMEYGIQPELQYHKNRTSWYFGGDVRYLDFPINIYVPNDEAENETQESSNFSLREKYRINTTIRAGSIAPYVKFRHKFANGLTSIFGIRQSYIRASGGIEMQALSPRLALEYELNKKTTLLTSWGRYVQMPRDSFLLKDFGNPSLGFTKAEHRIIGVKHKFNPLWNIQIEAYHKPMTDLVFSIPNQAPPENYKNIGAGEAYGIDFLIKRVYAERRMGWLSYSLSHSNRTNTLTNETYTFEGDQPHTLTFLWGQPLPGSWKKWDWSIRFHIRSGATYTPITGRKVWCRDINAPCVDQSIPDHQVFANDNQFWVPVSADKNSERLPVSYKMDIRFERPILFNTWKMTFYADLQNVTFAKNIEGYSYGDFYEKIDNPDEITGLSFMLPFLGIEAEF